MDRYLCIHGHFYQPPRENPWLEEVELQDSAYPYHDWNERITAECYAPNTVSRILDGERRIVELVNNYSRMSFNFGPTLLSWMERNDPAAYAAVVEADRASREIYDGHGSALAQCYNHMIMPLASPRDKRTQVVWGIKDFEHRFGRAPEGMWLPEAAVDIETLDVMAGEGITFTILSPGQASRTRGIGAKQWRDHEGGTVDPKMPYLCRLPSGRSIVLFFYDGPVSHDIAFGGLLARGEKFADRLMDSFVDRPGPQLVHIATDGESYGHHHRFGEMALSYCMRLIDRRDDVEITIYGDYLEKHPPEHEVEPVENSSWSCVHGVERWRDDCGCNSGMHRGWHQQWRAPLRAALDWLAENLGHVFEQHIAELVDDGWKTRDDYIETVLLRNEEGLPESLTRHFVRELADEERVRVVLLLEMQRHAMLMYTSCGWFFDEVSGIETTQVICYAARAIQLAHQVSGLSLEETFRALLEKAPSNLPVYGNARAVYDRSVKPSVVDLVRVGAHYAVSSLFEDYSEDMRIYCYRTIDVKQERREWGRYALCIGKLVLQSLVTRERQPISFAVLYFGDFNLVCGVRDAIDEEHFRETSTALEESFDKRDIASTISLIEKHFGEGTYSLWHLFRDEQRKVLSQILGSTLEGVEGSLRQIRDQHYSLIDAAHEMGLPLPGIFARVAEAIHESDLHKALECDPVDQQCLENAVEEALKWSLRVDKVTLGFIAAGTVNRLMRQWGEAPEETETMEKAAAVLRTIEPLKLETNLWKAQNSYFELGEKMLDTMREREAGGEQHARQWLRAFTELGDSLYVRMV